MVLAGLHNVYMRHIRQCDNSIRLGIFGCNITHIRKYMGLLNRGTCVIRLRWVAAFVMHNDYTGATPGVHNTGSHVYVVMCVIADTDM